MSGFASGRGWNKDVKRAKKTGHPRETLLHALKKHYLNGAIVPTIHREYGSRQCLIDIVLSYLGLMLGLDKFVMQPKTCITTA